MVHHPVNRRGGGHGVGKDAFPLREDQVGRDAQRPPFVAFGDGGEEDLRFLGALGQVAQVVQEQEVEVVQLVQLSGQDRPKVSTLTPVFGGVLKVCGANAIGEWPTMAQANPEMDLTGDVHAGDSAVTDRPRLSTLLRPRMAVV